MTVDANRTLAELVYERPERADLFAGLRLDFCCHGDRTLADACREAGVAVDDVAARLAELDATPAEAPAPWEGMGVLELIDHIESTHHRYLAAELPVIDELMAKVVAVHGANHGELAEVARLYGLVRNDLEPHLRKEEQILHPAMRALAGGGMRDFPFGSIRNPIGMMMYEHDEVGTLLAQLRTATGEYTAPDDACGSYRLLYDKLARLEADTHMHIFKENGLLYPAVVMVAEQQ